MTTKQRADLRSLAMTAFPAIFGLALLTLVVARFDWHALYQSLSFDIVFFFLTVPPIVLLNFAIRAWRYRYVLAIQGIRIGVWRSYLLCSAFLGLGSVTPLQAAESLRSEAVRESRASRGTSYGLFALERGVDFAVLCLAALISAPFLVVSMPQVNAYLPSTQLLLSILGAGILIVGVACLVGLHKPLHQALHAAAQTKLENILAILGLTLVSWIGIGIQWYCMFRSIDLEISLPITLLCMVIVTPISVLSMIPAGIGISELSIAAFLLLCGYSPIESQKGALAMRFLGLVVTGLGLLHFIPLRHEKNS